MCRGRRLSTIRPSRCTDRANLLATTRVRTNFVQPGGNQTQAFGIENAVGDKPTSMGSFIHHDLNAEKLEMARTLGLVTDYVIAATGPARRPDASVKVWRGAHATDDALKDYLVRLLAGLVTIDQIVIAAPFVASEAAADKSAREAPAAG